DRGQRAHALGRIAVAGDRLDGQAAFAALRFALAAADRLGVGAGVLGAAGAVGLLEVRGLAVGTARTGGARRARHFRAGRRLARPEGGRTRRRRARVQGRIADRLARPGGALGAAGRQRGLAGRTAAE